MSQIKFPINPFEIVTPSDYYKYDKTKFTEDYIAENLRRVGWEVFQPSSDKGIDRIISKRICLDGCTPIMTKQEGDKCACGNKLIKIIRFLQIKSRELDSNNKFGMTLDAKDFLTDPRIIFVFFSDKNENIMFIPTVDYVRISTNNNATLYRTYSFKKGNYKVNSISISNNQWKYNNQLIDQYVNEKGLEILQSSDIDKNFDQHRSFLEKFIKNHFLRFNYADTFQKRFSKNVFAKLVRSSRSMRNINATYMQKIKSDNWHVVKSFSLENSVKKYYTDNPEVIDPQLP